MFDHTVTHTGSVEVHYYFHHVDMGVNDTLARIEAKLDALTLKEGTMTVQLDNLTQAVQRNSDAEAAAAQLLAGLADQVRSLAPTQEAIDELASQIGAQADAMAAAVVANTPAAAPSGGGGAPSGGPVPETGGTTGAPAGPSDTGEAPGAPTP